MEMARDGLERVARFVELEFLRYSPFHLAPCGGCGGPSFGQPCAICNFYPMGPDKGIWHPTVASEGYFLDLVDKSGPDGRGGNIATWLLSSYKRTPDYRQRGESARLQAAIDHAAELDLPPASLYWEVVVRQGESIHRPSVWDTSIHGVWAAVRELGAGIDRMSRTDMKANLNSVVRAWVSAVHAGNEAAALSGVRKLQKIASELRQLQSRNGNLVFAVASLSRACDAMATRLGSTRMNLYPVEFVSVWDGGHEIETKAMIDLETGIVDEIQVVDVGDDVSTLDEEKIVFEGVSVLVKQDAENVYRVQGDDLLILRDRILNATPAPGPKA